MSSISLVESQPITDRLDRLSTLVERLAEALDQTATGTEAEWLPRKKIAARFGLSPRQADLYLASAVTAGKLAHFKPADLSGRRGHTLYRVSEFEAYIRRLDTEKP